MAADGSVIIDVLLDGAEAEEGLSGINKNLSEVGSTAQTVAKSLVAVVVALGAVFVGFSTSAVVAAAEAQAMNAQFDQVFGDLGKSAQTSIDTMGKEFGMVSSRLKPAFTSMTSMFKGLGLDTEDAMKTAATATTIVADSAAFYDKSFEDANAALNSFIKGNYEGGEAIGLFGNETQISAWAAKELGADWKKLDEAGKQLARLEYAKSMQEAAGATGQAARESDGLQNLLGNLTAVWNDLMVKFGTPILPLVTDWLKKIASAIQNFDATPFIAAFTFIWDELNKFVSGAVGIYETLKSSILGSGGLLAALGIDDAIIATLADYWVVVKETFMHAFEGIKTVVTQAFTFIMNDIVPILAEVVSIIMTNLETVQEIFNVAFDAVMAVVSYAFGFIQTFIVPILTKIVTFIGEQLDVIREFWDENGTQIIEAVTNAFNMVKSIIDFIMPAVLFVIDFIWTAIKQVITGALDVIMGLIKVFSGLFTGDFGKMWEGIKQIFFGAIDLVIGWMSLTFVGGLRTLLTGLAKKGFSILKGMWDDIAKVFTNMGSTVSGFVNKLATSIVNYFANILSRAQSIFGTLRTFGANIWNSIRSAISTAAKAIWDDVVKNFNNLVSSIKNIFGTVKSVISGIWDKVTAFFKGIDLKQVGIDIIQGLINGIGSMASAVWDKVKGIADGIKDAITGALDIHSPSRWMRDFVAGNMATGWIKGIDKSQNSILKKATQLSDWMKPEVSGGFINKLRGVSAPLGNIMPTRSMQGNSVSTTTNHSKTFSPNVINHFTPAESTPSEHARKQKQTLQRYAMEF